jgi:hypothetical protein
MTEDTDVPAAALIRDNTHLSRPTMAQFGVSVSAVDCTHSLPDAVASYVCDSLSSNTRRAYLSDLAEFERWGGSIPASIETVAAYLAARAGALAVATLVRHVASISKAHKTDPRDCQPCIECRDRAPTAPAKRNSNLVALAILICLGPPQGK